MSQSETPVFDRHDMFDRLDGDESLLTELIGLYVEERADLIGRVRQAVVDANPDAVAQSTHALRGTLLNVAATRAAESANRLEDAARQDGDDLPGLLEQLEGALLDFDDALRKAGFAPGI